MKEEQDMKCSPIMRKGQDTRRHLSMVGKLAMAQGRFRRVKARMRVRCLMENLHFTESSSPGR